MQVLLKSFDEFSYPAGTVVVVAIGDEDVVFVAGDYRWHISKDSKFQKSDLHIGNHIKAFEATHHGKTGDFF